MLALEEVAAAFVGQEEAVYLPSATMANEIALLLLGRRGSELLVEESAHIMIAELGGAAVYAGLLTRGLPGTLGRLDPEQIRGAIRPRDPLHAPQPSLLAVENTHNSAGGTVWPLRGSGGGRRAVARAGARRAPRRRAPANAAVASGRPAAEIGRLFDTVTLCFSKGLGCPLGAVLAGSHELMAAGADREAPLRRGDAPGGHRRRGRRSTRSSTTSSASPTTTRGRGGSPRAGRAAGVPVDLDRVQTNFVQVDVGALGLTPAEALARLADAGVRLSGTVRPGVMRALTHLDIDDDDIGGRSSSCRARWAWVPPPWLAEPLRPLSRCGR